MEGGKLGEDECQTQIEWDEHILDDFFDVGCSWGDEVGLGLGPTGSVDSWLADLEHLLLNGDESNNKEESESSELKGDGVELQVDDFQLCDLLLLDSPLHHQDPHPHRSSSSPSTEDEEGLEEKRNPLTCSDSDDQDPNLVTNNPNPNPNENEVNVALEVASKHDDSPDNDDPLSKKRKRQLRNRDAAMKSRERRKMYVKDLETKSRYLESECRRLTRLLHCCFAENQMLRFSTHTATTFGHSMPKPESAVLLPEALLLVSLVWVMGLMWEHPLARLLLLSRGAAAVAGVNRKEEVERAAGARVKGGKAIQEWLLPLSSYLRSKGCKASRTRMKCTSDSVQCPMFGNTSLLFLSFFPPGFLASLLMKQ